MAIVLDGTAGITTPDVESSGPVSGTNFSYTGTLTGGTGVVNLGSGQFYKDASGNVGIGTSSPVSNRRATILNATTGASATALYLVGTYGQTNDTTGIDMGNAGGTVFASVRQVLTNAVNGASALAAYTFDGGSLAERARIDSSGNLLVGKTGRLAGEKLSVEASGASSNTCAFIYGSADDRAIVISLHSGSSGGTSRKHYAFLDGGGFERGYITVNGSGTTYATSSDYRLKENIAPMAGALSVVQQLKPCTYTWKNSGIAGQGFIAHELQEVCPDAVTGEKDAVDAEGNPVYQGIDTSFLVATLTAAIQEQQALITAQQTALESLTARVVALETQP